MTEMLTDHLRDIRSVNILSHSCRGHLVRPLITIVSHWSDTRHTTISLPLSPLSSAILKPNLKGRRENVIITHMTSVILLCG